MAKQTTPKRASKVVNAEKVDTAGDDLDDGLDYSYDGTGDAAEVILAESGDDEIETEVTLKKSAKKRKTTDDDTNEEKTGEKTGAKKDQPKKKQKSSKLIEKKQAKTVSLADQKAKLATMDPSMIADYIANKVRFKNKDLSTIELNELLIPQSRIKDTSDFILKREDENFSKFIEFCKLFSVYFAERINTC